MIAGGYSDNVLADLTSGIGVFTGDMDRIDVDILKYFMTNCLCVSSNKKVDKSPDGLDRIPHAYSMLKFLTDVKLNDGNTVDLVVLRNPWGRYEWTGPFSDNDDFHWSKVMDRTIRPEQKDDGVFVMKFSDWQNQFEALR